MTYEFKPDIIKNNNDTLSIPEMLPSFLQTRDNKRFLEATAQQLFAKEQSENIAGYIGNKPANYFNSETDYYINENNKIRQDYQLEPTAVSVNNTNTVLLKMPYNDIINVLRFQGALTDNHSRLFSQEYYSFCPPIDLDKFINFSNYFWVESGSATIKQEKIVNYVFNDTITLVDHGYSENQKIYFIGNNLPSPLQENIGYFLNIIDKDNFKISYSINGSLIIFTSLGNIPIKVQPSTDVINNYIGKTTGILPDGTQLKNGLRVIFTKDVSEYYNDKPFIIEGVGDSIILIDDTEFGISGLYDNQGFDTTYYDFSDLKTNINYITIKRGSKNGNLWSKQNRWFNKELILNLSFTNLILIQATKPIIEFINGIELYDFGLYDRGEIKEIYTNNNIQDIIGKTINETNLIDGDIILTINDIDASRNNRLYSIFTVNGIIGINILINGQSNDGSPVKGDNVYDGESYYYFNGLTWIKSSQSSKIDISNGEIPLFNLFDYNGNELQTYNENDFIGSRIFGYSGNFVTGNIGKTEFENYLETERFNYINNFEKNNIPGLYFFKNNGILANGWNNWVTTPKESKQFIRDEYIIKIKPNNSIQIPKIENWVVTFQRDNELTDITLSSVLDFYKLTISIPLKQNDIITVLSNNKVIGKFIVNQYQEQVYYIKPILTINNSVKSNFDIIKDILFINDPVYINDIIRIYADNSKKVLLIGYVSSSDITKYYELSQIPTEIMVSINSNILLNNRDYIIYDNLLSISDSIDLKENDFLQIYTYNKLTPTKILGRYEPPLNLIANPNNETITKKDYSTLIEQIISCVENQDNFTGSPISINNYYNLKPDFSKGENILQHSASMLKLMFLNMTKDTDVSVVLRWSENEYRKFYNRFQNKIIQLYQSGYGWNIELKKWVDDALSAISLGKSSLSPFYSSGMYSNGFIPASTAFLGITPLYRPYKFLDNTLKTPIKMIRLHDGQLIPSFENNFDYVEPGIFTGDGITTRFDLKLTVLKPIVEQGLIKDSWNFRVNVNGFDLIPEIDYSLESTILVFKIAPYDSSLIKVDWSKNIIDQVILYMENTIYNNVISDLKNNYKKNFDHLSIKPGAFRDTDYSRLEWAKIQSPNFNRWATEYSINQFLNNIYEPLNPWTWNYSNNIGYNGDYLPGHWRGIYHYYYDTDRPHTSPWEMLGLYEKPIWWDIKYGLAPYTANNTQLWDDIENGFIDGTVIPYLKRPGIKNIIPVDSNGNLLDPISIGLSSRPFDSDAQLNWTNGDMGPAEFTWFRTLGINFGLLECLYLAKPAKTIEMFWDTPSIKRINNQLLDISSYNRVQNKNLSIHTLPNIKYGIQQYFVDYLKFLGKDPQLLADYIHNLDVRLGYFAGSFLETTNMKLSTDNFGNIPDNNYQVQLYKTASKKEYTYSGLIFRNAGSYYEVKGYDNSKKYFTVLFPNKNSDSYNINIGGINPSISDWGKNILYVIGSYVKYDGIYYKSMNEHTSSNDFNNDLNKWILVNTLPTIGGINVKVYSEYLNEGKIQYNTRFSNSQDIFDFISGYQHYLAQQGWVFDHTTNDGKNIADFIYFGKILLQWIFKSPKVNETLILSPFADSAKINISQGYIESLDNFILGSYGILDAVGASIKYDMVSIYRNSKEFSITPDNSKTTQKFHLISVNSSELEHCIIFDNITAFNDYIYNPLFAIKQPRLKIFGMRASNWNGTYSAPGFIITNNNIIANFDKSSDDIRFYYDSNKIELNKDINNISKHLIGYQDREYYNNLLMDSRDGFKSYQGFIKEKGTLNAFNKIIRNNYAITSDLTFFEEWAVKIGTYGSSDSKSFIEINIKQDDLKENIQIIRFLPKNINDNPEDSIIDINENDPRYVYKRFENTTENQFKTKYYNKNLLTAGYPLLYEVDYTILNFGEWSSIDISSITDGKKIWVANNNNDWNVYRITFIDTLSNINKNVITTSNNLVIEIGKTIIFGNQSKNAGFYTLSDNTILKDEIVNEPINIYQLNSIRVETISDINSYETYFIDNIGNDRYGVLNNGVMRVQPLQIDILDTDSALIYDNIKETKLIDLEIYHPNLKIIPISAEREINYFADFDPAKYKEFSWGKDQVGLVWWDLSTAKFLNYDQGDLDYKTRHWGELFPGSTIDIYEWVKSTVPPSNWESFVSKNSNSFTEGSTPYNSKYFTKSTEFNILTNSNVSVYYYWIKNNGIVPEIPFRKKSILDITNIITSPTSNGLIWYSPLTVDSFMLVNSYPILSDHTNIQITFNNNQTDNQKHSEWVLIKENYPFKEPHNNIWLKIKHSLTGYNIISGTMEELNDNGISSDMIFNHKDDLRNNIYTIRLPVPDPNIKFNRKYGNLFRPRQTWFKDRLQAVKNIIQKSNELLYRNFYSLSPSNWKSYFSKGEDYPLTTDYIDTNNQDGYITVNGLYDRNNLVGSPEFYSGKNVLVKIDQGNKNKWSLWNFNGKIFNLIRLQKYKSDNYWNYIDWYKNEELPKYTVNSNLEMKQNIFKIGDNLRLVNIDTNYWKVTEKEGIPLNTPFFVNFDLNVAYQENDTIIVNCINEGRWIIVEYNSIIPSSILTINFGMITGDTTKVLNNGDGTWAIFQYDGIAQNGIPNFSLVGLENGTIQLNEKLYSDDIEATYCLEYILDGLYYELLNISDKNTIVVNMIQEAHSQNTLVDWAFKTSFIDIVGLEEKTDQYKLLKPSVTENIFNYFNEVKPFHAKIRTLSQKISTTSDDANIKMEDNLYDQINLTFDSVSFDNNDEHQAQRAYELNYIPKIEIPGYNYSGTTIDGNNFKAFIKSKFLINGPGFDNSPFDITSLGYDFSDHDLMTLYDTIINGKTYTNNDNDIIIDGGKYNQFFLNGNHPPELIPLKMQDSIMINIYTKSISGIISGGYDDIGYDTNGYGYIPDAIMFELNDRPKIVKSIYIPNGVDYIIGQWPQKNDSIKVFVNEILMNEIIDYNIIWNNNPIIRFNNEPNGNIEIISFSIGGGHKVKSIISKQNSVNTGIHLTSSNGIYVTANGKETGYSFNDTIININCNDGDLVYIVIFDTLEFSNITRQNNVSNLLPTTTDIPDYVYTMVYKNGKRLIPPFTQYYDIKDFNNTFRLTEKILSYSKIEVYDIGYQTYKLPENGYIIDDNSIITNNLRNPNTTIMVSMTGEEEFNISNNILSIYTVAKGINQVINCPAIMVMIDGILCNINGYNIDNQLRNILGNGYYVSYYDGYLKIIRLDGNDINIIDINGSPSFLNIFGVNSNYSNSGDIKIYTFNINNSLKVRTEVFRGNVLGEYPTTKIGYDDQSIFVYVNGLEKIIESDYTIAEIKNGYDIYGYDENTYSIQDGYLGVKMGYGQNESDLVIITTFNGLPTEVEMGLTILKDNMDNFHLIRISDNNTTILVEPLKSDSIEIMVKDGNVLSLPNQEKGIPGSIIIGNELIHFWNYNFDTPGNHILYDILRGSYGTAFGTTANIGTLVRDAGLGQRVPIKYNDIKFNYYPFGSIYGNDVVNNFLKLNSGSFYPYKE